MDLGTLAALVGLALIDSTSIGTLVLPLVMLTAPRVDPRRYLLYLGTVGLFYAAVGIALVLGVGVLADGLRDAGDLTWLRWAQLVVGIGLFAFGVAGDHLMSWLRRRRGDEAAQGPGRLARWRDRLIGPEATPGVVVAVALGATVVELAGMLPFLAATGVITAAGLPVAADVGVVLGYALVMIAPALLLLVLRQSLHRLIVGPLARFSRWLEAATKESAYWVAAIVGFFVAGSAAQALELV